MYPLPPLHTSKPVEADLVPQASWKESLAQRNVYSKTFFTHVNLAKSLIQRHYQQCRDQKLSPAARMRGRMNSIKSLKMMLTNGFIIKTVMLNTSQNLR